MNKAVLVSLTNIQYLTILIFLQIVDGFPVMNIYIHEFILQDLILRI